MVESRKALPKYRLSGDAGVGEFRPRDSRPANFPRVDLGTINRLRAINGATATVSDALDELGWSLSVSADVLRPRHAGIRTVVGQALTLRYLPTRRHLLYDGYGSMPPMLAHHVIYEMAEPGDVMVVDEAGVGPISVWGGIAAATAAERGLGGVVVDGGVRDIEDIVSSGIGVWARYGTPKSGKGRMEAVTINGPILCGGVQVLPGDLVVADSTGMCFVPIEVVDQVVSRVCEVSADEEDKLAGRRPGR